MMLKKAQLINSITTVITCCLIIVLAVSPILKKEFFQKEKQELCENNSDDTNEKEAEENSKFKDFCINNSIHFIIWSELINESKSEILTKIIKDIPLAVELPPPEILFF